MEELEYVKKMVYLAAAIPVTDALIYILKTKKQLGTGKVGNKLSKGTNGVQLSKHHQLSYSACQGHISLWGPTRAGKSTNVIIPNLLQDNLRGSIIVYDPSLEIHKLTSNYQKSIGRKVIVYNPLKGDTEYNILQECKTEREVIQLAQSFLINGSLSIELSTGRKAGGSEWLQLAENLLASCLLYSWQFKTSIKTALRLITEVSDEDRANILSKAKQRCTDLYNAYMGGCDALGMQASIKGTITSNLKLFYDDLSINKTSFTADMLRKEECIVYVTYPENQAYYLSPLMAPLYSQIINKLMDSTGLPVWFILDEFANIGQFSNFNLTISTCAKRDILFLLCLQDFNQLKQVYGHDIAQTIWSNTKTKIVLPGLSSLDTIRMLSELCDDEEIIIDQNGKQTKAKKRLFTPGEIRRLETGNCLIVSDNYQPLVDETNYYKNNKQYLERCSNVN